jgi:hypothetical protein
MPTAAADQTERLVEGLKLINDWCKWVVTVETFVIGLIGTFFSAKGATATVVDRALASAAVICFLVSIVGASMLLATLPEIIQSASASENIWMTKDSVAYRLFGFTTQTFAVIIALSFGGGLALSSSVVVSVIWAQPYQLHGAA